MDPVAARSAHFLVLGALVGALAMGCQIVYEVEHDGPPEATDRGSDQHPAPDAWTDSAQHRVFLASGEQTRRGSLHRGTFQDSHTLDGVAEVILAEVDRSDEKLEHEWLFDTIPAGIYRVNLVAIPYSPEEIDFFALQVKTELEKGHDDVLKLESSGEYMSYEGAFVVNEDTLLQLRVKLPNGVTARDEERAESRFDIDYLALTSVPL